MGKFQPRTCSASQSNGGSKPSNANATKGTVDVGSGQWYTFGVGSTTVDTTTPPRAAGRPDGDSRPSPFQGAVFSTFSPLLFAYNEANFLLPLALFVIGWLVGWSVRHRQKQRAPEHEPLDVIWCWRVVNRRFRDRPDLTRRLRFVWRPVGPSRTRDTGTAYPYDDGGSASGTAEVYANVVDDEAEAVVTAIHELAHLQQKNGRHDRAFFLTLRTRLFGMFDPPPPPEAKPPAFKGRASIHDTEAAALSGLRAGRAKGARRPAVTLRWHRRARLGATP